MTIYFSAIQHIYHLSIPNSFTPQSQNKRRVKDENKRKSTLFSLFSQFSGIASTLLICMDPTPTNSNVKWSHYITFQFDVNITFSQLPAFFAQILNPLLVLQTLGISEDSSASVQEPVEVCVRTVPHRPRY